MVGTTTVIAKSSVAVMTLSPNGRGVRSETAPEFTR
jgi:hypothetical protein